MESRLRTLTFTAFTLAAFAANSVLARAALGRAAVDPISFTTVRLASGTVALVGMSSMAGFTRTSVHTRGSWVSAAWLLIYALPFSLAYTSLSTATGALILFGAVQVTMLAAALWFGERPSALQYAGFGLAFGGFLLLVVPGLLSAPPPIGVAGMSLAGVAWAVYSLRGRSTADPLAQTTGNFVRAVPVAVVLGLAGLPYAHIEWRGVVLAVVSGALTTGVGYVLWYSALRGLTATAAGVVQLLVPVLAAAAGVILLGESVSPRLLISAVLVLGGIALVIVTRKAQA